MLNCIIIDDELTAISIIEKICEPVKNLKIVGTFQNPLNALKYLNNNVVNLVFLDLQMPVFSGIDFLEVLKQQPVVIITSSDKKMIAKASEFKLVANLFTKPLQPSNILSALSNIISQFKKEASTIVKSCTDVVDSFCIIDESQLLLTINEKPTKLKIEDIYYIQEEKSKLIIVAKQASYELSLNLENVLSKLENNSFIRIHKKIIVNLAEIIEIKRGTVCLKEQVLPIGASYKKVLLSHLNVL
ncbi:LytTR family DNA-binding domain-containing protein [Tenacibaculum sp. HL-MS23]|uniref:LytR/AlgR family response regulator transcription factor n=1 Tax=Tenacibaculum sp. HL-MS23 TaxID=3077734 RepID=UPI0028FC247C|nr:LytTR family DNA-binding domain-containing protein [Tenacibaculum sp. HL-MS23]WNW02823.1 LytTR family DNA-binding domain-containing protein [Tenacibaculum sp. HL-MS23]